jgi:hypothetical protein
MIVVCIDNESRIDETSNNLTVGKKYTVCNAWDCFYRIINDTGNNVEYSSDRFITLEEYRKRNRNEMLNKLLQ